MVKPALPFINLSLAEKYYPKFLLYKIIYFLQVPNKKNAEYLFKRPFHFVFADALFYKK